VGRTFRLVAPDRPAAAGGRLDLVLARGAFGSGEHETTESCLEALEDLPEVREARLLDLGSGTGVLALAALRLGARHAVCVDVSPAAVEVTRRNLAANGVADRAEVRLGGLEAAGDAPFDLVLANVYADVLLDVAPGLVRRTRPGGLLLLSGILWEANYDVRRAYELLGCEVTDNRLLEEYSTVSLRRIEERTP